MRNKVWLEVFVSFQVGATCLLCGTAVETGPFSCSALRQLLGPLLAWLAPSSLACSSRE